MLAHVRALLVAVAGGAGALTRYWVGLAVGVHTFPWATLGVNTAGSLALGFLLAGPGSGRLSSDTTTILAVGFLGAFTTFSTFAYETWTFLRTDRPGLALTYVAASVAVGLAAAAAGYAIGRALS